MSPIFTSKSTAKSLWQEYHIYKDRIEFITLMGRLTVPFNDIEKIEISESELKGLFKGDLHLKDFRPALKLDWANFTEHIVLDKHSGKVHRILFTPEDNAAFKQALDKALAEYRSMQ